MVLLSYSGFFPQSHLPLFLLKFGMGYDRSLILCIYEGRILWVCYTQEISTLWSVSTMILSLSLNINNDTSSRWMLSYNDKSSRSKMQHCNVRKGRKRARKRTGDHKYPLKKAVTVVWNMQIANIAKGKAEERSMLVERQGAASTF
jgi:hypothetical protein